jgi:hypothetical protein
LLLTEDGKKTKKRTIPGITARDMYVVKFDENMLEPIEMQTIKYREKQKKILDKKTGLQSVAEVSYITIEEEVESVDDL